MALRFLLAAASDITASDVDLAFASEGIILGFNQEPNEAVQAAAKQLGARRARRRAWARQLRPAATAPPGAAWAHRQATLGARGLSWKRACLESPCVAYARAPCLVATQH